MECLQCGKGNVPLFRERNNGRIFCGVPCQKSAAAAAAIGVSIWLDVRAGSNLDAAKLWDAIVTEHYREDTVVEDFLNYDEPNDLRLFPGSVKKHNENLKEMLSWLDNNPKFSKLNARSFLLKIFLYIIQHHSLETKTEDIARHILKLRHFDPSDHGNWVIRAASEFGHEKIVRMLLQDDRVNPSANYNYPIRMASQYGHATIVELLLQDQRVDPSADNNEAVRTASLYGHVDVVHILLGDARVDPSAENNYAIQKASEGGHAEIVRMLLKYHRVDPSVEDNHAIRKASEYGHTQVVHLLLADKRVDPSAKGNLAIKLASAYGYGEIVQMLMKHSQTDASADDNFAIRIAVRNNHAEVVRVLLQNTRVLSKMNSENFDRLRARFPTIAADIDAARASWSRLNGLEGTPQEEGEGPVKRLKDKFNLFSL